MVLEFLAAIRREGPVGAVGNWWAELQEEYTFREAAEGGLFAAPYLLLFASFMLYPLTLGLYMSFFDWDMLNPDQSEFIGLGNYQSMFSDPLFLDAMVNTVYFVVLTVPPLVLLPLLVALGINRDVRGKNVLRTIFFSPYILTVAIVAVVWVELFQGRGLLVYYLGFVLEDPPRPLIDELLAMPAIAIATIWWTFAFNFIILLAARQNVPERLYEAAKLDGASSYQMLRDVTLPQIRNPMIFVVIITFVGSFQVFGQPFIMTDGGPDFSTHTIVMYLYTSGFNAREFGYAAAIGYVLFTILVAVSLVNYYILSENN